VSPRKSAAFPKIATLRPRPGARAERADLAERRKSLDDRQDVASSSMSEHGLFPVLVKSELPIQVYTAQSAVCAHSVLVRRGPCCVRALRAVSGPPAPRGLLRGALQAAAGAPRRPLRQANSIQCTLHSLPCNQNQRGRSEEMETERITASSGSLAGASSANVADPGSLQGANDRISRPSRRRVVSGH
jgi:hypothetical protein